MSPPMQTILFFLVFASVTTASLLHRDSCPDWEPLVHQEARRAFLFSDESFVVPRDVPAMNRTVCGQMLDASTRLNAVIKRCLKPFPEMMAGFFGHGVRQTIRESCKDSTAKALHVSSMSCIRDSNRYSQLANLVQTYAQQLQQVYDTIPNNVKFDHTFCLYQRLREQIRQRLLSFNCSSSATQYLVETMDGSMREGMRYFDQVSLTYRLHPGKCDPLLRTIDSTPAVMMRQPSFLVPLIKILTAVASDRK